MATKEVKSLQTLNKQSYQLKFDLEGTDYEPIENIGTGAYGIVCSAVCKRTKDRVAIKKISPKFDHIDVWKSTYREIRILRHFKHENIISIRDILQPKNDNFKDIQFVLDFMESDLHKIIHTQDLSDEHIRYFLYQILRGLKYIHSANVIHRDLKPSNLLVNANCELKIGDFGMSRVVATCSREKKKYYMTQYVATRWYRAPELIIPDGEYSFSVDLWSVGCILAEMIAQKVLFRGSDPYQQYSLIVQKCGTPSKEYLEKYAGPYMQALTKTHYNPVDWAKEFPKAHRKSLQMLGKFLRIDPSERVTAEVALNHPYLSKYHEPQDEPLCKPALDADFEEKINATEQLRKLITDEIMIYNKPANFGIPNLKPVPVEQVKLLTNKKHQALLSENAVPQLSPRTTGLESFLQLQKKRENVVGDNSAFKKPFPAAIIGGSLASSEDLPSASKLVAKESKRPLLEDGVSNKVLQNTLNPEEKAENSETNDTTTQDNAHQIEASKDGSSDEQNKSPSAGMASSTVSEETSNNSSTTMKQRIREAILKGQVKQRPVVIDTRPKPVTAHQRRKEKEKKRREKMEARRKHREKEEKSDEMSQMDLSMLARWEEMRKKKQQALEKMADKDAQLPPKKDDTSVTKDGAVSSAAHGLTSVPSGTETVPAQQAVSRNTVSSGSLLNSAISVSAPSINMPSIGASQAAPVFMNVGGPVLSSGFSITQNVYIPLPTNVPLMQTVAPPPVMFTPEVIANHGIRPMQVLNQTVSNLSNGAATPVVILRDNNLTVSQPQLQTNLEPVTIQSAIPPKLISLQPNVMNNNTLPFATYQTVSPAVNTGLMSSTARFPAHVSNTDSPKHVPFAQVPLSSQQQPIAQSTVSAQSDLSVLQKAAEKRQSEASKHSSKTDVRHMSTSETDVRHMSTSETDVRHMSTSETDVRHMSTSETDVIRVSTSETNVRHTSSGAKCGDSTNDAAHKSQQPTAANVTNIPKDNLQDPQEDSDKPETPIRPERTFKLIWQDQNENETEPITLPFGSPNTSQTNAAEKRSASETLSSKIDPKKMRVNTSLQPVTPVIIITPTGKRGQYTVSVKADSQLPSASSDSGASESAPASGLKRDWQQAINMDPKELEEALQTVMQTDMPSPRFVSDLIDPKQ